MKTLMEVPVGLPLTDGVSTLKVVSVNSVLVGRGALGGFNVE